MFTFRNFSDDVNPNKSSAFLPTLRGADLIPGSTRPTGPGLTPPSPRPLLPDTCRMGLTNLTLLVPPGLMCGLSALIGRAKWGLEGPGSGR